MRWVERSLYSGSLEGEHAFSNLSNSVLHWQYTYSRSTRDEPDLREMIRGAGIGRFLSHFFHFRSLQTASTTISKTTSTSLSSSGHTFLSRTGQWNLKFGYRGTFRRRNFEGRLFRYLPVQANTINFKLPFNQLLGSGKHRPEQFVHPGKHARHGYIQCDYGHPWRLCHGRCRIRCTSGV